MAELNTERNNQKDMRILVAEDNPINQKLIQQILEKAGYGVDLVDNGRQAVEFACQIQYDMIFMDIQMPLMDGYTATRRIRKWESERRNAEVGMRNAEVAIQTGEGGLKAQSSKPRVIEIEDKGQNTISEFPISHSELDGVPIIALTGNNLEAVREKCFSLGMNDCIGKPLFRDQLLSLIKRWTGTESAGPSSGQIPKEVSKPVVKKLNTHQPIDLNRALSEFMGEKEVLNSLLNEFIEKVRSQIEAIQQAFLSLDFKEIAKEAHSIKGGAANLTANKVAGIASALEKAAGLKQADLAKHLVDQLETKVLQLENYLQEENSYVHGV
jgi:CheY-like chemotaxis protein